MTAKELLVPRFELIADYPNNHTPVGDIIVTLFPEYFRKFKDIFREMHWSEKRDIKDMPKYLSFKGKDLPKEVMKYSNVDSFNCHVAFKDGDCSFLDHFLPCESK